MEIFRITQQEIEAARTALENARKQGHSNLTLSHIRTFVHPEAQALRPRHPICKILDNHIEIGGRKNGVWLEMGTGLKEALDRFDATGDMQPLRFILDVQGQQALLLP